MHTGAGGSADGDEGGAASVRRSVRPSVRPSAPADEPAILRVVETAFSQLTGDASQELTVVRRTWGLRPTHPVLELVAEVGGTVVGHVLAAAGSLDGRASAVAGVAPLSVVPSHQHRGVGSALLGALVSAAERRSWPLLVLLGDPAFYGRAGFEPAAALGITYAGVAPGDPHFQARRLHGYDGSPTGAFVYAWE